MAMTERRIRPVPYGYYPFEIFARLVPAQISVEFNDIADRQMVPQSHATDQAIMSGSKVSSMIAI